MSGQIEPALYIDEQSVPPARFCPACRGCLYAPSFACLRCGEDAL